MGVKYRYSLFQIKLVNINTTDVVDGRPSIVLGLIWTIILYFQARAHRENTESFAESVSLFFITESPVFPRLRNSPAHSRLRTFRQAAPPRWTAPTAPRRPARLSNANPASPFRAGPRRLFLNGFRKLLPSMNFNLCLILFTSISRKHLDIFDLLVLLSFCCCAKASDFLGVFL